MTDEELAEVKARAEKATPGPWVAYGRDDGCCGYSCTPDGCHESHPTGDCILEVSEESEAEWSLAADCSLEFTRVDDAEFCAHAREDIPALLAEVERLRRIERAARHPAVIKAATNDARAMDWGESPESFAGREAGLLAFLAAIDQTSEPAHGD